jgi:predicted Fe-Mo cluster-binding NifX family protein
MIVAIPTFGPRVSPRFDYAPSLLLFNLEDGKVAGSQKFSLQAWDRLQRLQKLKDLGVQTLICGGIDGNSAQVLSDYRIRLIAWVAGEADEAIRCFLEGRLRSGIELCPRCRRGQKRGRKFRWA